MVSSGGGEDQLRRAPPPDRELWGMVKTLGLDRHVSKLKEWYP